MRSVQSLNVRRCIDPDARYRLFKMLEANPGQVPPDSAQMRAHAAKLGETDLLYPERRMQALAAREGIEGIFLAEPFARHAAAQNVYLHGFPNTQMGGGHWNEKGHALAARLVALRLCPEN